MDKQRMQDIKAFIEANFEDLVKDIARLVAINSVRGEAGEGMPFGPGPREALDVALQIASELGLETVNCQNKIGYAQLGGDGERYLATITHVDVVPSPGWREDPFTLRRKDGWMIGRGVMDDKGPSVLCLYALKYLKDRGIELRYPIRALLGSDEESGMEDLEHYLENYPQPLFCFSPDSDFPLCNGEKGIVHASVTACRRAENIIEIEGGVAPNVIPDSVSALVRSSKELACTDSVKAEREGENWRLTAHGIGGHASHPEGTVNAIAKLVDYILENELLSGEELGFFQALARFHSDPWGAGIGAQARDDKFDPLTIIGGMIYMEEGCIVQSVDCRYPACVSGAFVLDRLRHNFEGFGRAEIQHDTEPFYMDPQKQEIRACLRAYEAVTGEKAEPYTIGGGTYARHFRNAVSFGPEHPERPMPDFAGPIHGVDEAASEEYFKEALEVYILALLELEDMEL